jgi:23S rRNA (uracil1939-C5)-methyltransferase
MVLEWGQFSSTDIVYDLYCGTGSIAIYIAKQVQKVIGIELVPQSIEDAKQNCDLNRIENCSFIQGDLKERISETEKLISQYGKPDVIIIDPPRSGMHPDIPYKIIELSPDRIIYVSCNPATFARDLKVLCDQHYSIVKIQPVDMFPHTAHCEVVALLSKNDY